MQQDGLEHALWTPGCQIQIENRKAANKRGLEEEKSVTRTETYLISVPFLYQFIPLSFSCISLYPTLIDNHYALNFTSRLFFYSYCVFYHESFAFVTQILPHLNLICRKDKEQILSSHGFHVSCIVRESFHRKAEDGKHQCYNIPL